MRYCLVLHLRRPRQYLLKGIRGNFCYIVDLRRRFLIIEPNYELLFLSSLFGAGVNGELLRHRGLELFHLFPVSHSIMWNTSVGICQRLVLRKEYNSLTLLISRDLLLILIRRLPLLHFFFDLHLRLRRLFFLFGNRAD